MDIKRKVINRFSAFIKSTKVLFYFHASVAHCIIWVKYPAKFCLGVVHKGCSQRKGGGLGQMWTPADREGVKDFADIRKLVLFCIIPVCFADALYGWCLSINCTICATQYGMGWHTYVRFQGEVVYLTHAISPHISPPEQVCKLAIYVYVRWTTVCKTLSLQAKWSVMIAQTDHATEELVRYSLEAAG